MKSTHSISISIITAILATIFITSIAQAHKLNVFAYEDGNTIVCEATWAGGKKIAYDVAISVKQDNKVLITGKTNNEGIFTFPAPSKESDINITADSGDGHLATWKILADDFISTAKKNITEYINNIPTITSVDEEQIRQIVREELVEQLAPIKRHLAAQETAGPSLQDILGGLGYIIGLLGLAAYLTSKKK